MKNIYNQLAEKHSSVKELVLATVTRSHGSTPQKPGCSAIIGINGVLAGTVGGGIVEGKVIKIATAALSSGQSGHYTFDLAHEISDESEAICGGKISVLIDANIGNSIQIFNSASKSLAKKIPGVLITMVTSFTDEIVMVNRYWMTATENPLLPDEFLNPIVNEGNRLLSEIGISSFSELKLSVSGEEPEELFFLEALFPPPHLVIAGAGHIGRALAHLGSILDFEVTVIDNRREFANKENIPDADNIITGEIGQRLSELKKDENTYVVIVTRGHKDDASALKQVIGAGVAYVGMIGSRKKIAAMRADFIGKGLASTDQWEEIYAPVGLDIKSQTIEEIAVSIAAQLILVRNRKK